MEGRQIQNTKLEATCVLLVVITKVALTWSAKRATSRINSAWSCSIPQGFPQRCCSIANNIVQFHIVWSMKQWNPRHWLTHTCVIVSSIIRCGVDSSWLVGEIVNIDRGHNVLQACDSCFVIHATKPLRESHHWSDCVVDKMAILSLLCSNGSRVRDNFLKTRMVEVRDESSDWS